jgi:uncharacterized protein (TIGR02145 family)
MKAVSSLWTAPNTGATNSSGFTGLPGGLRGIDGTFFYVGGNGYWWSSTQYSSTHAWYRGLSYYVAVSGRNAYSKPNGFSVRCVRD